MRRVAAVLLAGTLLVSVSACSRAKQLGNDVSQGVSEAQQQLDAARSKASETAQLVAYCTAALRTVHAVDDRDFSQALDAGRDMVGHAPAEIHDDAQRVLDGLQQYRDGDQEAVQSDAFQQAAKHVASFTRDRCDPRS